MSATAALLASLDIIAAETTAMLTALDTVLPSSSDRREAKRRVLEIREYTHELLTGLQKFGSKNREIKSCTRYSRLPGVFVRAYLWSTTRISAIAASRPRSFTIF
jgi:hypothetical protein